MIRGYARVSTRGQARDGNSLEAQEEVLRQNGAEIIYKEFYTGTTTERPEFERLLQELNEGDQLIVTKLDRFARSTIQGIEQIQRLQERGITIHILNMGLIDQTATGKLIAQILLAFAEFERNMIVERTQEGKARAKQKPGFHEGRPKKYTDDQLRYAVKLLEENSYSKVVEITGVSRSTLIRVRKQFI